MIDVREKAAKQFSARLTGRGFESWVREGNDTYVVGGQEYIPQDWSWYAPSTRRAIPCQPKSTST